MDYLVNFEMKPSNFYGLPKVHKSEKIKTACEPNILTLCRSSLCKAQPDGANPSPGCLCCPQPKSTISVWLEQRAR